MESTPQSRDNAWFDDLYSDALERATAFSDSYLDQAFAEISVRLNAIRIGSKPELSRAVTEGQLIQLQHLLPELEYSDAGDELTLSRSEIEHQEQECSQPLEDLDYSALYEELEYEDLRYEEGERENLGSAETTVTELLSTLNQKSLGQTATTPSVAQHDLPLPDVFEHHDEAWQHSASKPSMEQRVAPAQDVHFSLLEADAVIHTEAVVHVSNSEPIHNAFVLLDEVTDNETTDHSESELLFEAVNDDVYQQEKELELAQERKRKQQALQLEPQPVMDHEADRVSRIPNEQAPIAIQTGSNLLQVDPASIAQALVEMYLENERILNAQQEDKRAAEARQKRQFRLVSAIAAAVAVMLSAAIVIYYVVSDSQKLESALVATSSDIPPAATSVPLIPYQSVNIGLDNTTDQPISGEVRNPLSTHSGEQGIHPAADVGADEFNYFDQSMYEPDSYADADREVYPEAVSDNAVVVEKRVSDVSLHEKAYTQWHAGDVDAAKQAYLNILASNSEDTEALVGLGSMAQRNGNDVAAVDYLVRAVKTKPDHAYALAALASLSTNVNRAQLETDLMRLAKDNPNVAELPFILGNWYARDKRWSDAQQAYFDAFNRNTLNADYAYNLAIALDQIGKSATAESYYRKAIALAVGGNPHFDISAARDRAEQLGRL